MSNRFLVSWLLLCLLPTQAYSHDGPPFPLIVDQQVGPCILSVWTDPDVGTGTFFVIANSPQGGSLPQDLKITVAVQPVSGRLTEVTYPAEREPQRGQVQFKSVVQFDAQELWRVRIRVYSERGSGETLATVEATPPGFGRWDLLIYLAPFLAVGFLWLMAFIRKRRRLSN
jgi:hypothetical protein